MIDDVFPTRGFGCGGARGPARETPNECRADKMPPFMQTPHTEPLTQNGNTGSRRDRSREIVSTRRQDGVEVVACARSADNRPAQMSRPNPCGKAEEFASRGPPSTVALDQSVLRQAQARLRLLRTTMRRYGLDDSQSIRRRARPVLTIGTRCGSRVGTQAIASVRLAREAPGILSIHSVSNFPGATVEVLLCVGSRGSHQDLQRYTW